MNEAYLGKICPYCKGEITSHDNIVKCSACDMPHHRECWIENQGCTTFGCDGTIQSADNPTGDNIEIEIYDKGVDSPLVDSCVTYCGKCGTKADKDAAFCSKCGNKIVYTSVKPVCIRCGSALEADMQFCPKCGTETGSNHNQNNYIYSPDYGQFTALNYEAADIQNNKGISVLCYFGILLLIPLLSRPNSQFVKFHANQGLICLLTTLALSIICAFPFIGVIGWILELVLFIWEIQGIVHCIKGEMKEIPILGKHKIIK